MKTPLLFTTQQTAYACLPIIIFLTLITYSPVSEAQVITQVPQIVWGRYFDDTVAGSHFDKEDIGDRIYYFDNTLYFVGRTKSDSLYPTATGHTCTNPDGDAFVASYNPVCQSYNWIRYLGGPTAEEYAYC